MKFGSQLIDEIKTRIKVSDIVSKKVKLSPRGREFVGLSPFSNEKTPSFTVSDEKGFYHCFSSGEHGSVFDFVMKTENLSFVEAVKKLASYAGISVEDKVYKKEDIIIQKRIKNLKDILTIANNWFHNNLKRELKTNKFLQEIFKKRNFNENIINTFLLGYAPKRNDTLYSYLKSKDFSSKDISDAGLIIISSKNNEIFDRFNNRIIFPIYDYSSNVVGFGGKALSQNQIGKYVNSPSTDLFKKGDLLFGWQQSKNNPLQKNELFIVEGYTDVISMHMAGYKNVVAPLGTAITAKQIICSWRISKEPIICMDGDEAGQKAAKRLPELIFPHLKPGHSLNFVKLPFDEDPDSLISSNNLKDLNLSIDNKLSLVDYVWNNLISGKTFNTPEKRAELEEEINRLLNLINDFNVKKNYKNFFREKFFEQFKFSGKNIKTNSKKEFLLSRNIIDTNKIAERVLIGSVILFPSLLKKTINKFSSLVFSNEGINSIKDDIVLLFNKKKTIENLNIRATLLNSKHKDNVLEIIDKSILLHAPFLKSKDNLDLIEKKWNEYLEVYLKKIDNNNMKKKANEFLTKLNQENYQRFKNIKKK
ncbi:MAG: DNA primase [Alphaproteobacteria bacterium MarineAlpha6_Bin6]|nr:DNA primase [Pelagibacteraceae bacterium]PPR29334.1 MAG: DNA primase [Alphaproteobacteria bacterium MarineAlpha6_Bin6]PPR33486.1 MAG: DNA primase [Alphaproteobacteria bacterium MarineAlpha6_Bin5]|tara:strand:- start:2071 stop:3840 length:1770 start_codon:yes stop_codon:yes gene_type:complete